MSSEPPRTRRARRCWSSATRCPTTGPTGGLPCRRSADLAQYRCRPTRLGSRADRPDRLDLPRRVVGGHPGPAGVGRPAAGRRGDLRDQRHGLAALAAADGVARADPLRAAAAGCGAGCATATAGRSPGCRRSHGPRCRRTSPRSTSSRPARQSTSTDPASRSWRRCPRCTSPTPTARSHRWRDGTVAAITEWADEHDVPLVDLKAAVADAGDERAGQSRRHPLELRGASGRRRV